MTGIQFRGALIAFAVVLTTYTEARAVTFTDDFATSPFPSRWCERWHHVHWGGIANKVMLSFTSTTPCDSNGCCPVCTDGCSTPNANVSGLITKNNYTGMVRSASIDFRFPVSLASAGPGAHVAVFPVFHPNCHTGYEGVVAPDGSGGYKLNITRAADSTRDECDEHMGFFTTGVNIPNITLGTTPRYRLILDLVPAGGNPAMLNAFALVWDTTTSQTLATTSDQHDLPSAWYNTFAKRFAIGGVQSFSITNAIRLDNFSGMAN